MPISEVFPKATVKQVIFQIRYPSLFSIEAKMGDLQADLMPYFPESALGFRHQIVMMNVGPNSTSPGVEEQRNEPMDKVWSFSTSDRKVSLNITASALDISSEHHKTYNLPGSDRFRDIIEVVLASFRKHVRIPVYKRVGLRYVDECPIVEKSKEWFGEWYNTAFPLHRFDLSEALEMRVRAVVKKGDFFLSYAESLRQVESESSLILDFDAFALDVNPETCLAVTDSLHGLVSTEFENSIREPLFQYMRGEA